MSNVQQEAVEALQLRNFIGASCLRYPDAMAKRAGATPEILEVFVSALAASEIVLWKNDMYGLARKGAESFIGTSRPRGDETDVPLFFHMSGFHFDVPEEARIPWELPAECNIGDSLLMPSSQGLTVVYIIGAKGESFPYLRPMEIPSTIRTSEQAMIVGMKEFLGIKLAAREPVLLPRGLRRRMARKDQEVPPISIVQLRQRDQGEGGAETTREYHHRWIVKGHWRRLHEPRKTDGAEVTFVDAYVKGPNGAPLLQPRDTVYAVTR